MIRWLIYLVAALIAEVLAIPAAFVLPIWCRGSWPAWSAWFSTPDNPPEGDIGHRIRWLSKSPYWQRVSWLLRNRAYGFKWGPLAAPMDRGRIIEGDPHINSNVGRFGLLRITMGKFWQWKLVKPIGKTGRCVELNFGWLLDDESQKKALFMFSLRIQKLPPTSHMS